MGTTTMKKTATKKTTTNKKKKKYVYIYFWLKYSLVKTLVGLALGDMNIYLWEIFYFYLFIFNFLLLYATLKGCFML